MNQSELRILANAALGTGPKRPSRKEPRVELPKPTTAVTMRNIIEREVARIIDAAPSPGESVQHAFDRKEQELRALFLSLTRAESIALHAKLIGDRDAASSALVRLSTERRSRVLARLSEATCKKAVDL